jgi:hypothetical protein
MKCIDCINSKIDPYNTRHNRTISCRSYHYNDDPLARHYRFFAELERCCDYYKPTFEKIMKDIIKKEETNEKK